MLNKLGFTKSETLAREVKLIVDDEQSKRHKITDSRIVHR